MKQPRLPVVLLFLAAACSADPVGGPDPVFDAGPFADAAQPGDAGTEDDAGSPEDAGEQPLDAGTQDAGEGDGGEADAGSPVDAGEDADAGEVDGGEPDAGTVDAGPQPFAFAVIGDLHIGQGYDPYLGEEGAATRYARLAVERVNRVAASEHLPFVFVIGDLTDSAEETEFARAREILDGLQMPWFPIIGNHDVWRHESWSDRDTKAIADAAFVRHFSDRFQGVTIGEMVYEDFAVWNPGVGHESHFVNFELRYQGHVFLGLDWSSRQVGIWPVRGSAPEADLFDFPGGTLPWMVRRLSQVPAETRRVFLVQHQGIRGTEVQPSFYFTFDSGEAAIYREVLLDAGPADLYWGVFAGHTHRRWEGTAFDEWPEFRQMETAGAANSGGEITVVRVAIDGTVTVGKVP